MVEQRVSYRYAKAILNSMKASNNEEMILKDLETIKETLEKSKDLMTLFRSPVVGNHKKEIIFKEVFKDIISADALNFLLLLNEKGREKLILYVIIEFEKLYNNLKGILPFTVNSAVALDDNLKNTIIKKVQQATGK